MESQCVGLAEAMGLQPVVKRVRLRKLWRDFSPYLNIGKRFCISHKRDQINPPWPDIVIASGRHSILPSLYIKEMTGGKSFNVQIQDPALWHDRFDAVIVPAHDKLSGSNIISTEGALHRVNPAFLAAESAKWMPTFAHLPKPYTAVILGGSNSVYTLTPKEIMQLGPKLEAISKAQKTSLLITPSRRTGAANMALLRALLHDCPTYIWDGEGDNPYYGMLGAAENFIVTCDSINMISEACSTGKPVYVVKLPGGSDKFNGFHQKFLRSGRIRFLEDKLESWPQDEPLREMERVAALIRRRYDARKAAA